VTELMFDEPLAWGEPCRSARKLGVFRMLGVAVCVKIRKVGLSCAATFDEALSRGPVIHWLTSHVMQAHLPVKRLEKQVEESLSSCDNEEEPTRASVTDQTYSRKRVGAAERIKKRRKERAEESANEGKRDGHHG